MCIRDRNTAYPIFYDRCREIFAVFFDGLLFTSAVLSHESDYAWNRDKCLVGSIRPFPIVFIPIRNELFCHRDFCLSALGEFVFNSCKYCRLFLDVRTDEICYPQFFDDADSSKYTDPNRSFSYIHCAVYIISKSGEDKKLYDSLTDSKFVTPILK